MTLNVRLWPRVSALLVDPAVLRELDDTELGWLRQASANVVGRTRELAELDAAEQPPDVPEGCAAEEPVTAVEGQDPEAWDGPTIPDGLTAAAQRLATSPARSQPRASTSRARTLGKHTSSRPVHGEQVATLPLRPSMDALGS